MQEIKKCGENKTEIDSFKVLFGKNGVKKNSFYWWGKKIKRKKKKIKEKSP